MNEPLLTELPWIMVVEYFPNTASYYIEVDAENYEAFKGLIARGYYEQSKDKNKLAKAWSEIS